MQTTPSQHFFLVHTLAALLRPNLQLHLYLHNAYCLAEISLTNKGV